MQGCESHECGHGRSRRRRRGVPRSRESVAYCSDRLKSNQKCQSTRLTSQRIRRGEFGRDVGYSGVTWHQSESKPNKRIEANCDPRGYEAASQSCYFVLGMRNKHKPGE